MSARAISVGCMLPPFATECTDEGGEACVPPEWPPVRSSGRDQTMPRTDTTPQTKPPSACPPTGDARSPPPENRIRQPAGWVRHWLGASPAARVTERASLLPQTGAEYQPVLPRRVGPFGHADKKVMTPGTSLAHAEAGGHPTWTDPLPRDVIGNASARRYAVAARPHGGTSQMSCREAHAGATRRGLASCPARSAASATGGVPRPTRCSAALMVSKSGTASLSGHTVHPVQVGAADGRTGGICGRSGEFAGKVGERRRHFWATS